MLSCTCMESLDRPFIKLLQTVLNLLSCWLHVGILLNSLIAFIQRIVEIIHPAVFILLHFTLDCLMIDMFHLVVCCVNAWWCGCATQAQVKPTILGTCEVHFTDFNFTAVTKFQTVRMIFQCQVMIIMAFSIAFGRVNVDKLLAGAIQTDVYLTHFTVIPFRVDIKSFTTPYTVKGQLFIVMR